MWTMPMTEDRYAYDFKQPLQPFFPIGCLFNRAYFGMTMYNLPRVNSALLLALAMLAACQDDDHQQAPANLLPESFKIEGTAEGTSAELNIDCVCDLIVEIDSTNIGNDGQVVYRGTHGGHFSRRVLDENGAGIALVPDVFGDILISQFPDGAIDLDFPANHNTGSRFWDSIGLFRGSVQGEMVSGTWTCAPFDTREDSAGIVAGTWQLVPID